MATGKWSARKSSEAGPPPFAQPFCLHLQTNLEKYYKVKGHLATIDATANLSFHRRLAMNLFRSLFYSSR